MTDIHLLSDKGLNMSISMKNIALSNLKMSIIPPPPPGPTLGNYSTSTLAMPGTSITCPLPTATVAGDLMIACWMVSISGGSPSDYDGWGVMSVAWQSSRAYAMYKIADGTETDATFVYNSTAPQTVGILTIKSASMSVAGLFADQDSVNPAVAASIDAIAPSSLIGLFCNYAVTSGDPAPAAPANMVLAGHTSAPNQGMAFYFQETVPSGATGTRSTNWITPSWKTQMLIAIT